MVTHEIFTTQIPHPRREEQSESPPRVAFAVSEKTRGLPPDETVLLEKLAERGITAEVVVWSDLSVLWSTYDLVIPRCAGDWIGRRIEFLTWLQAVPRSPNSLELVRWNIDKKYLRDLISAEISTVPTTVFEEGDSISLPDAGEYVVKPAISRDAIGAARFNSAVPSQRQTAEEYIAELHEGGQSAIVQPFISTVETYGETSLVYFNGAFSHAARKSSVLDWIHTGQLVEPPSPRLTSRNPLDVERRFADHVLEVVAQRFCLEDAAIPYARVDLVPRPNGSPVLLELELIDPEFYFAQADEDALERFVGAISELVSLPTA